MKAYVKKGCIDSNRDAHEAGAVVDLDKNTDKKLWDLKLVEDYDEKKHGLPKGKDGERQAAKIEIAKLKDEKATLETKVGELEEGDFGKLKKEMSILKGKNTKLENELKTLKA